MTPLPAVPTDTAAPTLQTESLGGQRGERPLFRGLDLCLKPGELLWLRGRNGRGKTSLLRLLAGLATPAHGRVLLGGHDIRSHPGGAASRLLYLGHANALKDDLSAAEALLFLAVVHGHRTEPAAIGAALTRLGVGAQHDAPVRRLSQGQRRRVALARLALPQPPGVWLLDEPFDALDDEGIAALYGLLAAHAHRGGSALFTSHQAVSLQDPAAGLLDLDAYAVARA